MNFAGFIFFSTLEYLALFYLMFVLFRISIREYFIKFGTFSLVLSFVSNTLQMESLRTVSPLIHIVLYICFAMFFLRVSLLNATIMAATAYVMYMMTQWVIIVWIVESGINMPLAPFTLNAYMIQAATAIIIFTFGLVIYLQKGGFSFIEHNSRIKNTKLFVADNRLFIFFLIFSVGITFLSNLLFVISSNPPMILISILMVLGLIGLIYTCMKKDDQADGRNLGAANSQSNQKN